MKRMSILLSLLLIGCLNCMHKKEEIKPKPDDTTIVTPIPTTVDEVTKEKTIIVYFDFDSDKLSNTQKEILKDEIVSLKNDTRVLIIGHTDSVGTEEYNQKLSARRAREVSRYLESFHIPNEWLAKGETELLNEDKTSEQHKVNRRVEINFTVVIVE